MRKNKTGGRKFFTQTVLEAEKRYDGTPNPRAGKVKQLTHQIVPKDPPPSGLWGAK